MMTNIKYFYSIVFIAVLTLFSKAQPDINNLEYKAESIFNPVVKDAQKISANPEGADSVKRITNITYGINSQALDYDYKISAIDKARLVNEPLNKLYKFHLRAGLGTYFTPYGELFFNNTRSRDIAFGAHLKHLSSASTLGSKGYSGYYDNQIEIFGKKYFKVYTLSGNVNYERNKVHYYGYDKPNIDISSNDKYQQIFNYIETKAQLKSYIKDSTKINHQENFRYYNFQDLYGMTENNLKVDFNGNKYIQGELLNLDLGLDYYNNRLPSDTFNNTILRVYPYFSGGGAKWKGKIGIEGVLDNFKTDAKTYIYPHLEIEYNVYNNMITPFLNVTGGLQKNSFRSLTQTNPWIRNDIVFKNSSTDFSIGAGLKGSLSSKTNYIISGAYEQFKNMPLFNIVYTNGLLLNNKFDILYDNGNMIKANGQLMFDSKTKWQFKAEGNYYHYKFDNAEKPWHKPEFDLTFNAKYNLKEKIFITADVIAIGPQWARSAETTGVATYTSKAILLDPLVDVNLGAEYKYSKMLGAFLKLNNIGNFRYQRWERYPTQRFWLMAGVNFSF
jgi:hypothetical protein